MCIRTRIFLYTVLKIKINLYTIHINVWNDDNDDDKRSKRILIFNNFYYYYYVPINRKKIKYEKIIMRAHNGNIKINIYLFIFSVYFLHSIFGYTTPHHIQHTSIIEQKNWLVYIKNAMVKSMLYAVRYVHFIHKYKRASLLKPKCL